MNNLYNIINTIKHITLEHPLVMRFTEGDVYTNLNEDKDKKYPAINLDIDNINIGPNYQTVNGNLFYIDRLLTDESNRTEVQAVGMRTLQSVINKLAETYNWNWTSQVYNIFTEKFADLCAGVYVTFSIEVPAEEICADDVFVPAVINITKNGEYDVAPYDKAVIDVNAGETYITSTGVVLSEPFSFLEYVCKQGAYPFTEIVDDSITVINRPYAFYNQTSLMRVAMSALTTISGNYVFYVCTALQSVTMPALATLSGTNVFMFCTALQSVTMPALATLNGSNVFYSCSSLQSVTMPALATLSGNGVFA